MPTAVTVAWQHAVQGIRQSPLLHPRTQEERNIRLLYLNTAIVGVPSGGLVAFLPVFVARLGASSSLVGWLTSAPSLLMVFALVPAAIIAERNPDQVRVRVLYAWLYQISYLLCAILPFFISVGSLPIFLVVIWTIRVLPEAVAVPSWTSVLARAVSPERRARVNGTRWALLSLVSAAASLVFGWMLDAIVFPINYQLVFVISFATAVLDPLFFSRIKVPLLPSFADSPRGQALTTGTLGRIADYFRPVVSYRPFLLFLGATLLYRVALNAPTPLFTLYWVNELRASNTLIGLRGMVGNMALVVGYIFWGRSANRLGHRRVLFVSALGYALYPVMTGFSTSAWWILPAAGIWGLTAAGLDIGLFDIMLASCPDRRGPLFAAVWSIVANAAIFAGPLLGAALSDATSLGMALIIAGIAQVVTTVPFAALPRDV